MLFFDVETHLIAPGRVFPPFVCGAFTDGLRDRAETVAMVRLALEHEVPICGHNVAFDLGCVAAGAPDTLPAIFAAYRAGRIHDTMIRQELCDIAAGCHNGFADDGAKIGYSLASVAKRLCGLALDKSEDTWRLRYAELDGVPLDAWPEAALAYPLDDVEATRDVYLAQEREADPAWLVDAPRQARHAFALALTSGWGVVTDAPRVDRLEASWRSERAAIVDTLRAAGLLTVDKKGEPHKSLARIRERICAAYPSGAPTTPTGAVETSALVCRESGDPILERLARYGELASKLAKDLPLLRLGICHTRYGLAASGRSTSSGPNLQNLPRKGGVRECFVPRPGRVFAICDYGQLELFTLAQTCLELFGFSDLAEALRAGEDPHLSLAAQIVGCSYADAKRRKASGDPEIDNARQVAKVANFGFPGGLSPGALVGFALATYGVRISYARACELRDLWASRWREMDRFFDHVRAITNARAPIEQIRSGRVRGGCSFTDGCNTYFQGLGADVAKDALFDVAEECYARPESALFGSRPVLFPHDEIVIEAPEERARAAGERLREVMIGAAKPWLDLPIGAELALARRYSKDAKGVETPWDCD